MFSYTYSQISNEVKINLFQNSNYTHFLNNNQEGLYPKNKSFSNIEILSRIKYNNPNIESKIVWSMIDSSIKIIYLDTTFDLKKIKIKLGSFNSEKLYISPQYSSGSMIFSKNAKKIPGFSMNSKWRPILNMEYKMEFFHGKFPKQKNYVDGPYLHYKSVMLRKKLSNALIGFSIQHAVQFGGYDINGSKIPIDLTDFSNVVFSRNGSNSQPLSDQLYRAGNALGAFTLSIEKINNFKVYYEHYIEDKSGLKTLNFGDGLLGINIFSDKFNLLFELVNTKNQSGNKHPPGADSYYSHQIYNFGWSNDNQTIGNSFIHPKNNRIFAYNLGLIATHKSLSYHISSAKIKSFIPYQGNNNNQPYENHNDLLDTRELLLLGLEKMVNENKYISIYFSKDRSYKNVLISYKLSF